MEKGSKRKRSGEVKHLSFVLNGVKYTIGDYTWMWSGSGDPKNRKNQYVAEILDVWADNSGLMWMEASWYSNDLSLNLYLIT